MNIHSSFFIISPDWKHPKCPPGSEQTVMQQNRRRGQEDALMVLLGGAKAAGAEPRPPGRGLGCRAGVLIAEPQVRQDHQDGKFTGRPGAGGRGWTAKGPKGTFQGDENGPRLSCGDGSPRVCGYQNPLNCVLK